MVVSGARIGRCGRNVVAARADGSPSAASNGWHVPRARSRERARQAARGVPVIGAPLPPPGGEVTGDQRRTLAATFGAVLRDYRVRAGLTQAQLGARAGVDRATVGRFERGQRRPRLSTIGVLAAALSLDSAWYRRFIASELADAAGPWLVDGPGGRVRGRRRQMRRLDDLQGRIKLQRQTERKLERLAENAGPGEFGDRARAVLAAVRANTVSAYGRHAATTPRPQAA